MNKKIGFIGQGFIGKSYSDDFETRGYQVIRYSLDPAHIDNVSKLHQADTVFIAVNAATKPKIGSLRDDGTPMTYFDDSNIKAVIPLTKPGTTVVIKSTLPPGKTKELQDLFPDRTIFHSPEFLTEETAVADAKNPLRNIIGVVDMTPENILKAEGILQMFPTSTYQKVLPATTAELIKYGANAFLFAKILFTNVFYDLVEHHDQNWKIIQEAISADPRIGPHHMGLHLKTDDDMSPRRRGAGRSCFIKDMAQISEMYASDLPEKKKSLAVLRAMEYKNAELLRDFDRYVDILESVYGKDAHK